MAELLPIRIVVCDPPSGVQFAVQSGKADLIAPANSDFDALTFDLEVRLGSTRSDGGVAFMPPVAQGPASDRFIYVNSGVLAGDCGSPWTRRAKVKLATIDPSMVAEALKTPGAFIEGRIAGMGRGGGPPAGTVPLLDEWRVIVPGRAAPSAVAGG